MPWPPHRIAHLSTSLPPPSPSQGIPIEDLTPFLVETVITKFGGKLKPEYAAEHAAWQKEQAEIKAEEERLAAEKAAKKAAQAAAKAAAA